MVDYDKKIDALEKQAEFLRKEKEEVKKKNSKARLDMVIDMLYRYGYRAGATLYVGDSIYDAAKSFFDRLQSFTMFSYISLPIKYRGFTIFRNTMLSDNEIQIAYNSNDFWHKFLLGRSAI